MSMNKRLLILVIFIGLILIGCSNEGLLGGKPPKSFVEIDNERFETTLGTYCWQGGGKGTCIDTAGPIELLEGKKPIQVKPGENLTFVMDYESKPNEFHVVQMSENKETEVVVKIIILPHLHKREFIIILMAYGGWMKRKRTYLMVMPS